MGTGPIVFFIVVGLLFVVLEGYYRLVPISFCAYLIYAKFFSEPEFQKFTLKVASDTQKEFFWKNSKGRSYYSKIYYCKYPKGVIFFYHGLNNFSDKPFTDKHAKTFTDRGYIFATYDQEGFGKSAPTTTKRLGYVESWGNLISDAEEFIEHVYSEHPEIHSLPFFTYGISMGGAVCLLLSLRILLKSKIAKGYRGMVLLAPAILNSMEPHFIVLEILRLVYWLGGGWLRWGPVGTDKGWKELIANKPISEWPWRGDDCFKSEVELRESVWSPYPNRLVIGTGHQLLEMTKYLQSKLSSITSPFICFHGKADGLVPYQSSELLQSQSTSKDKDVLFYDRLCHAIPCDPLWPEIQVKLLDWIEKRT